MESVAFIQWCLDHLNYWTITLLMTIESSFIPFPSEVVVPPAAYKAAVNEELNIYLVVLFATLGANLGASSFSKFIDSHLYFLIFLFDNCCFRQSINCFLSFTEVNITFTVFDNKVIMFFPVVFICVKSKSCFFFNTHNTC